MKKFLCFAVAGALVMGLCGCNAASDFIRNNISDEAANAFDNVVEQGSQLIEEAGSQLKAQFAEKLEGLSDDVRTAVEEKLKELPEAAANTTVFTSFPNQNGNDVAVLANFPNAKFVATLTEYPVGTKFPDPSDKTSADFALEIDGKSVLMSSKQCQAYARYIQEKLYGEHDLKDGGNPDFTNILPESIGRDTVAAGSLTEETLKKAITAAGAGAHLRTQGKNHSMFIVEVSDTGFTVLQANADGKMTIEETTYTWSEYVECTFGGRGLAFINVYRPQ